MNEQRRILLVTPDGHIISQITDIFHGNQQYMFLFAQSFDMALDAIIGDDVDLVIAHNQLEHLNAIDLLAVVGRIKPDLKFIILDHDVVSKTAMAAFRLGALDYLAEPLNLDLLSMQIDRAFIVTTPVKKYQSVESAPMPRPLPEERIDPLRRALTFTMSRSQFQAANAVLNDLLARINGVFVGVLDKEDNITAAVGKLDNVDLSLLKNALASEQNISTKLAKVLGVSHFQANFYEGNNHTIYMIQLHDEKHATLVAICPVSTAPGFAWLHCKRTAVEIQEIIQHTTRQIPRLVLAFQ